MPTPVNSAGNSSNVSGASAGRELTDPNDIAQLVKSAKRIAVLGIKPETHSNQAGFFVPQVLQRMGFEIIPVPTYYPNVTSILGQPVERDLTRITGEVDIVDVFRRPSDIDAHVDDLIALRPGAVWFQAGIRNDAAAKRLTDAGIDVVQNRCLKVEAMRLGL